MHQQIRGISVASSYAFASLFAVALALSVLAHEIGHTVVSRAVGLPVRRIVVFLLGGVSEIEGEARRPRDEFAIAAAGPLVSFVLAAVCWLASNLPAPDSAPGVLLTLLAWSNLIIAVFNMLPGLPLDGGRLVQAIVWMLGTSRLTGVRIAAWAGRGVAVLLGLLTLIVNSLLARNQPVDIASLGATAMGFAIAAFLWFGAGQTLRNAELGQRAADLQIGHLIRPTIYLAAQTPISEAVRRATESRAAGIVIVDSAGRSRAIVQEAEIAGLPPSRRPWATVSDVSRSLEPGMIINDRMSGSELLDAVRAYPASEYLVIGPDGVTRGVLATIDLARALGLPTPGASR
jgi:Zn-dependent protease